MLDDISKFSLRYVIVCFPIFQHYLFLFSFSGLCPRPYLTSNSFPIHTSCSWNYGHDVWLCFVLKIHFWSQAIFINKCRRNTFSVLCYTPSK